MNSIEVVFIFGPVLIATLAVILRQRLWLRYLSIFLLLFFFLFFGHWALRHVARAAKDPPEGIRMQEIPYARAWREGTMGTQEMVNIHLRCLVIWPITLAVLALVPVPKSKAVHKKTPMKTTSE